MKTHKNQEGFSYIDVMIAITILMVGVLALVAAISASVIQARAGERNLIAKQYAASTLESIFSARDLDALGWEAIGNEGSNVVNGVAKGIFQIGRQRVYTQDGPDKVPGTDDDTGTAILGYDREITITDICDPDRPSPNCSPAGTAEVMLRRVQIKIYYQVTGGWRDETITTVISNSLVNQ